MSWAIVAVGAVSIGSSMLSSSKQKGAPAQPMQQIDPQQLQDQSIQGNINEQGNIEKLTGEANTFNQQQAVSMANQATPGYSKFANNLMQSGENSLANQYNLPPSVINQLQSQAAEANTNVGAQGQAGSYNWLRSLGINQVAYGQQQFQNAMSALTTAVGTAPRVSPMSPMSFYLTPGQQISSIEQQNQINQGIAQSGANASTAAGNANSSNMWGGISGGVGALVGSGQLNGMFGGGGGAAGGAGSDAGGAMAGMLGGAGGGAADSGMLAGAGGAAAGL